MLEHLFSMALHQSLINIFVAFWNPFLMSFVGVIVGVSFDNPSVHPYLPDGVYVNSLRSVSMVIFSIQLLVRLNFSFLILA